MIQFASRISFHCSRNALFSFGTVASGLLYIFASPAFKFAHRISPDAYLHIDWLVIEARILVGFPFSIRITVLHKLRHAPETPASHRVTVDSFRHLVLKTCA
jgi:hypothetical protein